MKTRTLFTAIMCLTVIMTARAQAPISPRAAMANCDVLTPQQYLSPAEYQAFLKKNDGMNVGVNKWMEQFKPEGKEFTFAGKKKATNPKQLPADFDPEKQMANLQRYAADMKKHYKLTDKEFEKMMNMNDKQVEAFIMKRCKELGIQPLDPSKYGMYYDPEEEQQDEQQEADAPKRQEAFDNIEAFDQRWRQIEEKNLLLYHQVAARIKRDFKADWEMLEKMHGEIPILGGVGGDEAAHELALQAYNKKNIEVQTRQYNVWLKEYILPARENLQVLLSYAEASDEGKFFILKSMLPNEKDEAVRTAIKNQYTVGAAAGVWHSFKTVTEQKVP